MTFASAPPTAIPTLNLLVAFVGRRRALRLPLRRAGGYCSQDVISTINVATGKVIAIHQDSDCY